MKNIVRINILCLLIALGMPHMHARGEMAIAATLGNAAYETGIYATNNPINLATNAAFSVGQYAVQQKPCGAWYKMRQLCENMLGIMTYASVEHAGEIVSAYYNVNHDSIEYFAATVVLPAMITVVMRKLLHNGLGNAEKACQSQDDDVERCESPNEYDNIDSPQNNDDITSFGPGPDYNEYSNKYADFDTIDDLLEGRL